MIVGSWVVGREHEDRQPEAWLSSNDPRPTTRDPRPTTHDNHARPPSDARETLRSVFGFDSFRPGQEPVIAALLEGRSSLAIFPTGGGKSLCYQLPALLLDGLTVVVSPLIALMKDQVDDLTRRGVAAARLDSSLGASGTRQVYDDLRSGRIRLLYVAPERLASERFVATLAGRPIALLAVDEAHCISEWGHNFRPEYLKLARLADRLGVGRVLALTATATPEVAASIASAFRIAPGDVVSASFHRPNLELHAIACRSPRIASDSCSTGSMRRIPGPAIVYVTLQRTAEELAGFARRPADCPPRRITPGSPTRSATPSRSGSWGRRMGSWWRRSRSGWGSTSPTSGRSSITTCPRGPRATPRRSAAPAETGPSPGASCSPAPTT